jgi:beta-galactosidase
MRKRNHPLAFFTLVMTTVFITSVIEAQEANKFFNPKDLSITGVYYYPEHWDPSQWERDFSNMAKMGFEFTHFAEFAWAQLEPEEGKYDFTWLDTAVELAAKYNLKVIMCTSTATPPVWLVRKHPEVLQTDERGVQMDHGSRQHATFSSNYYRMYSMKMIEQLAKKYGKDSRVIGWQLDNEPRRFFDYGPDALQRFRDWLKQRYINIDTLNKVWGNNFWSGTYSQFDQINIPKHSQWGMNLNQRLDHYRFADSETATFLDEQAKVIRKYSSPSQWITSNYIPMYDVGYVGMSKELDFVAYTRYMVYGNDKGIGKEGYRVGDYTRISMANDFFRPFNGYYGVMELQPGQVNWGRINPQPLPGAVRLWLWNVFAGGSKFACTYRYRAPLYGYEQYHYGIVGTDGTTPTPGGLEYSQYISEVKELRKIYNPAAKLPSDYLARKSGILVNADNIMAVDMNKQTSEWDTERHILKYYKALKSAGAPVDFIHDGADFSVYKTLIVPAYQLIDKQLIEKLTSYAKNGGNLILTCRTGLMDRNAHLWETKFYKPIYDLIGAEIESYDLPMPHSPVKVKSEAGEFDWTSWGDLIKPYSGTEILATYSGAFYSGTPAAVTHTFGKGTVTYAGVDTKSGEFEKGIVTKLLKIQKVPIENYPEGIIVEYRDGFGIAFNYSDKPYTLTLPSGAKIVIGSNPMKTADVLIWKY